MYVHIYICLHISSVYIVPSGAVSCLVYEAVSRPLEGRAGLSKPTRLQWWSCLTKPWNPCYGGVVVPDSRPRVFNVPGAS